MTLKEMLEKFGQVAVDTRKLADVANARADGKFTSEEEVQWAALHAECTTLEMKIQRQKEVDALSAKAVESAEKTRELRGTFSEPERRDVDNSVNRLDDRKIAMRGWAYVQAGLDVSDEQIAAAKRCGMNLNAREQRMRMYTDPYENLQWEARSQTVGTPTAGGYTTQGTMVSSIEYALLNYDGVRQAADVIRTADGNEMRWPTIDDTANQGAQVAEGGTRSAGTDVAVGQKIWRAYVYTSNIATITRELLQDSAFSWEQIIGQLLAERIKRKQAVDFTTGDGAAKPNGIVTAAATGVSAASSSAIVFDDLLGLEHSVDPDLRIGASFMFHDTTLLALKKLKDGTANYIWKPGTVPGAPSVIDGFPYYINQSMASTLTGSAISVLFGNMKAYKIRDVADVVVRRSDEYAWSTGKIAFVAEMRSDGNLLNPGVAPIKKLTH